MAKADLAKLAPTQTEPKSAAEKLYGGIEAIHQASNTDQANLQPTVHDHSATGDETDQPEHGRNRIHQDELQKKPNLLAINHIPRRLKKELVSP